MGREFGVPKESQFELGEMLTNVPRGVEIMIGQDVALLGGKCSLASDKNNNIALPPP